MKVWFARMLLWEHEWVTDLNVVLKENEITEALTYEIDVPCAIQWGTVVVLLALTTRSNKDSQTIVQKVP